jgi:hypothetical protein
MQTTVTIHIGDQSKVKRDHNRRTKSVAEKEKHINQNGEHEAWIDRNLKDVCEEVFGDSIREFNEKQGKNPSRKKTIESYMAESSKVDVNKNGQIKRHNLEREMVLYVGDKDSPLSDDIRKEAMKRFVRELEKSPNIIITGAYWHNDEMYQLDGEWHKSSPHVHLDFMMVSRENKRGMRVQSSEYGALKEMGYGTKKVNGKTVYERDESIEFCQGKDKLNEDGTVQACCPISFFTKDLRESFEGIVKETCKEHGIDVGITHTDEGREWLSKEIYGQRKDEEQHRAEIEKLKKENADKKKEQSNLSISVAQGRANVIDVLAKSREAHAKSREAQEELNRIQEQLSMIDEERMRAEEAREEAREQAEEVRKQVEKFKNSANEKAKELNGALTSKQAEIARLNNQIAVKKNELYEVKEKVSNWRVFWQKLEKALEPLKDILSRFGFRTKEHEDVLNAVKELERNEKETLNEIEEEEEEYER